MTTGFVKRPGDAYRSISKDPAELLDYKRSWANWLSRNPAGEPDAIVSVSWTVQVGLTTVSTTFDGVSATIRLSGGVLGETYIVSCTVTTSGGRTGKRSFLIHMEAR